MATLDSREVLSEDEIEILNMAIDTMRPEVDRMIKGGMPGRVAARYWGTLMALSAQKASMSLEDFQEILDTLEEGYEEAIAEDIGEPVGTA